MVKSGLVDEPLVDRAWAESRCSALGAGAVVVLDTGPVLHLGAARIASLLERAGRLVLPPAVRDELLRHGGEIGSTIECLPISESDRADALIGQGLHRGEAEAIALALEHRATWFLSDDLAAMDRALELGLMADGSLGVVHWAAAAGHLTRSQADACLTALAGTRLWVSARILARARAALDLIAPSG